MSLFSSASKWPVGITASPAVRLVGTAVSANLELRQRAALASMGKSALAVRPLHLPAKGSLVKGAVVRIARKVRKAG